MGECLHKKFAADLTKKKRNGKVRVCIFWRVLLLMLLLLMMVMSCVCACE